MMDIPTAPQERRRDLHICRKGSTAAGDVWRGVVSEKQEGGMGYTIPGASSPLVLHCPMRPGLTMGSPVLKARIRASRSTSLRARKEHNGASVRGSF